MPWDFHDLTLQQNMDRAKFGVEKETLRVTSSGRLAESVHPFTQDEIDRDFCENQVEMISSVHTNLDSLYAELFDIHRTVNAQLSAMDEMLWPFSNPPFVSSEDDILIAEFKGEKRERTVYRQYLAEKYGKAIMLFSGIHLNFSFRDETLQAAFLQSGESAYGRFKNGVYLELLQKLLQHNWLIVYLTAASPVMDESFARLRGIRDRFRYASPRCSEAGYWNDFLPILEFSSIERYCGSIQRYVDSGQLYSPAELYYPLRLKPRGRYSFDALQGNGVNHIELRSLDVNPLSGVGLFEEDVRFIHLLILYLMSLPDVHLNGEDQRTAIENSKKAALYIDTENRLRLNGEQISMKEAAGNVLDEISRFADSFAPGFLPAAAYQKEKLNGKRYAELIRQRFPDYITDGLRLAERLRGLSCACCSGSVLSEVS